MLAQATTVLVRVDDHPGGGGVDIGGSWYGAPRRAVTGSNPPGSIVSGEDVSRRWAIEVWSSQRTSTRPEQGSGRVACRPRAGRSSVWLNAAAAGGLRRTLWSVARKNPSSPYAAAGGANAETFWTRRRLHGPVEQARLIGGLEL